jgi:MFS family permease
MSLDDSLDEMTLVESDGPFPSEEPRGRLWTFPYLFLMFLGTVSSTAFAMVQPTIAKQAVALGASLAVAGMVAGLFSLTALIARPVSGLLADRLDRKTLLVSATGVLGLATLGYAVSAVLPALAAFRVLHGIAFSVSSTVNMAIVATVIPRSRLAEGIGYYGLGQILAQAVGPAIGLALMTAHGLPVTYAVAGSALLLDCLLMLRLPTRPCEKRTAGGRIRFADLLSLPLLPLALIGGIFSFMNGTISTFLVLVGDARRIGGIALYFTVYAVVLLLVRPVVGRISDRKGLGLVLYPAFALAILAAVLLGVANGLAMILAAGVVYAMAQGSAQPSLQATLLKLAPEGRTGLATSTYYLGADIGQGFGPIVGGSIATAFGYTAMFLSCAALFVIGAATSGLVLKTKRRSSATGKDSIPS